VSTQNPAPRQPIFTLPPMTKALLAANVVVCALMLVLPDATDDAIDLLLGFTPARYAAWSGLGWAALVDPVSYQFIHAGVTHLFVNMLGLVAFGAGVEQRLGRWRLLAFYLLCGIVGAFTELAFDPGSSDPMIGASAATSGLFGGILRLAVFRRGFWMLVVLWLVMNAVTGISGMGAAGAPVAWIAHVGGFAAGLLLYPLFVRPEFRGK
jgi:membrane associated rhomboid family serine protease